MRAGRPKGDKANGRQRLLDACWELMVETEQDHRLTIAAVCERAKCTPPTLYHHFGDLAALEREASRLAYDRWAAEVEERCIQEPDPAKRLQIRGQAYIEWAHHNNEAYTALFVRPQGDGTPHSRVGMEHLVGDLAKLNHVDEVTEEVGTLAFNYWANIHGLACLTISAQQLDATKMGQSLEVIARLYGTPSKAA